MRSLVLLFVLLLDVPPPFNLKLKTSAISERDAARILNCEQGDQLVKCCLWVKLVGEVNEICVSLNNPAGSSMLKVSMTYKGKEILNREKPIGLFCERVPRVKLVNLCVESLKATTTSDSILDSLYEGCLWLRMTQKIKFRLICYKYENGKVLLNGDDENDDLVVYDKSVDTLIIDLTKLIDRFYNATMYAIRRSAFFDKSLNFLKEKGQKLKEGIDRTKDKANGLLEKGLEKGAVLHQKGVQIFDKGKKVYKVGEGMYNRSKDAYASSKKTIKNIKEAYQGVKAGSTEMVQKGQEVFNVGH